MAAEMHQFLGRSMGLTEASRQASRLLLLPAALDSAITKFLEDHSSRELKTNVARLSATLRSVKDPVGQMQIRSAQSNPDQFEFKEGSEAAREALEDFTTSRPSRLMKGETLAHEKMVYTEKETAAYVAARMPAIYAAIHRVLHEVSHRVPNFRPSRMLDFGSGPGTALWATTEVWPETLKVANFVESSHAMTNACRSLLTALLVVKREVECELGSVELMVGQKLCGQDVQNLPSVRSYPSLLDLAKSTRRSSRDHDLVISSYTLGEQPTLEDRIKIVRQLWSFTSEILVLVEPGTPQGSATIRQMRSHILQAERKRVRRQNQAQASKDKRQVTSDGAREDSSATTSSAGAFVVAPCAHDGACPMDGLSTFCHFSQRVQRTPLQRISKRQGLGSLRAYEDEKFSFVVLRRGLRPSQPWPLDDLKASTLDEEVVEFFDFDPVDQTFEGGDVDAVSDSDFESDSESGEPVQTSQQRVVQAANMSTGWARIVRRPLRRGRHVLLDVCRSADRDGTRGDLNRVIWARKSPLGGHLRAKKLMWGDLWPC